MNPISQIELNAHFNDLEQQVKTARRSQSAAFGWLAMPWRKRQMIGATVEEQATGRCHVDRTEQAATQRALLSSV
jgi:hypothetical protein